MTNFLVIQNFPIYSNIHYSSITIPSSVFIIEKEKWENYVKIFSDNCDELNIIKNSFESFIKFKDIIKKYKIIKENALEIEINLINKLNFNDYDEENNIVNYLDIIQDYCNGKADFGTLVYY